MRISDGWENQGKPYYGFVYKWLNKDSEQYYIGQHKGFTNDGYVGSGSAFFRVYKEDPSAWKREILSFCESADHLDEMEEEMVGYLWDTDELCLNLCPGGNFVAYQMKGKSKSACFSPAVFNLTMRKPLKQCYIYQSLMFIVSYRKYGRVMSVCFYSEDAESAVISVTLAAGVKQALSVTAIKNERTFYNLT